MSQEKKSFLGTVAGNVESLASAIKSGIGYFAEHPVQTVSASLLFIANQVHGQTLQSVAAESTATSTTPGDTPYDWSNGVPITWQVLFGVLGCTSGLFCVGSLIKHMCRSCDYCGPSVSNV